MRMETQKKEDPKKTHTRGMVAATLHDTVSYVLAKVRDDGCNLAHATMEMRRNKQVALAAVRRSPCALKFVDTDLMHDKEVVLAAMTGPCGSFVRVVTHLRADREVVMAAVKCDPNALKYASLFLRADREIVVAAVEAHGGAFKFALGEVRFDAEVQKRACASDGAALKYMRDLAPSREVVHTAVCQNGMALQWAAESYRADRDIVMAALSHKLDTMATSPLRFVSEDLRADRVVVSHAIEYHPCCLNWAFSKLGNLCNDVDLLHKAIALDPAALGAAGRAARREVSDDRTLMLSIVERNGMMLGYASATQCDDREIVMAAVRRHGMALKFASATLRADREIVMAAVRSTPDAIMFVPPTEDPCTDLVEDFDVAQEMIRHPQGFQRLDEYCLGVINNCNITTSSAVMHHGAALEHMAPHFTRDPFLVGLAVDNDGMALEHASCELRASKAIVLRAVAQNGCALRHASEALKGDREVVLAAVTKSGEALVHAPPRYRSDLGILLVAVKTLPFHAAWAVNVPSSLAERLVLMSAVSPDSDAFSEAFTTHFSEIREAAILATMHCPGNMAEQAADLVAFLSHPGGLLQQADLADFMADEAVAPDGPHPKRARREEPVAHEAS